MLYYDALKRTDAGWTIEPGLEVVAFPSPARQRLSYDILTVKEVNKNFIITTNGLRFSRKTLVQRGRADDFRPYHLLHMTSPAEARISNQRDAVAEVVLLVRQDLDVAIRAASDAQQVAALRLLVPSHPAIAAYEEAAAALAALEAAHPDEAAR